MIKKKKFILLVSALVLIISTIYLVCHIHQANLKKDITRRQNSPRIHNDSIRQAYIEDQIKQENLRKQREAEVRANVIKDSLQYLAEPLISPKEAAELKPVLSKWLNFYGINIRQFRLTEQDTFITESFLTPDDTASLFYEPFDKKKQGKYTPQSRDYSPNHKRYINVLETSYVYQDKKDGKWYYRGSDDTQELRFVDVDRKLDNFMYQTGTNFVDAAFWKNNDCFIIVSYYEWDGSYRIVIYDLEHQKQLVYRLRMPASDKNYAEYDMKTRGIIVVE